MQSHKIQSYVLLLLLHFSSFQLSSSAYIRPDEYFINCGSDNNFTSTAQRTFTGDLNSRNSGFVTFSKRSSPIEDSKKSIATLLLYRTARLFRQKSFYEFKITNPGTYMLRLHFYAFPYPADLSTALFDVSASGFSLLHNFTMENSSNNAPVIKEFFLNISSGKLVIDFIPGESSLAFVNAIEAFLVPDSFISDDAPHVSSMGIKGHYNGILSKALQTIQRINVGGRKLTPDNDTLWRTWVPDDSYLYNPNTAKTSTFHEAKLDYPEGVSEYTAPDLVYQTAKEMNISLATINFFNITWTFNVSENTRHFVRVHFCDIVSLTAGDFFFNLYVYNNFSLSINPYQRTSQLATPFYIDFVVDSDDSGLMNITIGPNTSSTDKNAFLNGLEIMEIIGESVLVKESRKITVFVLVGSILGGLALISILAVVLCLILRHRKPKTVETLELSPVTGYRGGNSHRRVPEGVSISSFVPDLNLGLKIPFAEIMFATNNFDVKMRIGKGGFGTVFRGTLRNGMKVAVKRSEPGSEQGLSEFQTEIMVLSKIRHRHLVSLIGYCDERFEMILVYEFMENGALRDHLYGLGLPSLPWMQRLEICIGAARGLHYLHTGATGGFIHRDIKSTNILLDKNCAAKVADFGLSKLCCLDQTHVSTAVKGTFGYLDPEYLKTQQLTEKSDVYSFGVVLLEVLCARPVIDNLLPAEQLNLADWGMLCKDKGMLKEIIDPSIKSQVNSNSLRKFAEIAEKCLQEYGSDRPTMSDVLWDLEYALQLQQTATPREPHEDSRTNDSAAFALSNVPSFPSLRESLEKDDVPILREHSSSLFAGAVFSQSRMDDAR